jgi:hypothetical protein
MDITCRDSTLSPLGNDTTPLDLVPLLFEIPPDVKTGAGGGPATRHWMKLTEGGKSAGMIVP